MQEHRDDGDDVLTGPVTRKQINDALKNKLNRAVTIHKPGSVITHTDGRRYIVQADGSWRLARPDER